MSVQLTCLILYLIFASYAVFSAPVSTTSENELQAELDSSNKTVINKYPLTEPISNFKYRIAMISDLDSGSRIQNESNTWCSYLKQGYLTYNPGDNSVIIEWDPEKQNKIFISRLSMGGRGLELSELVTYNGQLITLDDKTGLVYSIDQDSLIPWVILVEGDGHQKVGMKNEWATVKDSKLYVGSHGTERGGSGNNLMWVKTVDKDGAVRHLNWTDNYKKLRSALGIEYPGYVIHESCSWSDVHGRWFFLPRKVSKDPYDDQTDPRKAANVLLSASPEFDEIKVTLVGETIPNNTHGFSSFKFIPGTNDTIITAIKSVEVGNVRETYIIAFTIDGVIVHPEAKVADEKFEGFEFI